MNRIRTLLSLRTLLLLAGMVTWLFFLQNYTSAQDIVDDECLDFACDVEGISIILDSTDNVEIDTYGETDISFDLLDQGFEADVVLSLVEDDINNVVDSDEGFDDGGGVAFISLSDAVEIGHDYAAAGDHYVFDDFSGEFDFVGSTLAEVLTFAPEITSIDPPFGDANTSGQFLVEGAFLIDQFDFSITFSLIPGVTITGAEASLDGTEVLFDYTIDANAPTGDQEFFIETRFGDSNIVTFRINDPTPIVNSVSPSTWEAGADTSITVNGRFFGICPTLNITGPGVTGFTKTSGSDTQVTGTVTVDASSAGGTATVDVTSDGYTCSGFTSNPGQPSDASNTANIDPLKPPPPKFQFFGTDIATSQSVMTGQYISLAFTVPNMPQGLSVSSQTWTVTGTAIASFTAGSTAGPDKAVALDQTSTTQATLNFYWLSASGSPHVTLSYCANNSQCTQTAATVPLTVSGPTQTGTPVSITTQHVVVFRRSNNTATQKFQDIPQPFGTGNPGITFLAQFNLPSDSSGSSGEYQWLQLENQDSNKGVDNNGAFSCTSFTGSPGTSTQLNGNSELDLTYPYGTALPGTVTTTNVTNDTAKDSPSVGLGDPNGDLTVAEWQRTFGATMFLRWKPPVDTACSGAGKSDDTCHIPVPLGSMTWGYSACTVNTLKDQSAITPGNATTWAQSGLGCPNNSQGTAITFSPSNLSAPSFGYPSYSSAVGNQCN